MLKKLLAGLLSCALTAGIAPSALASSDSSLPELRVYYSFDGAQKNADDLSGNGRNGAIYGTSELSDDAVYGQSLLLKGGYVHMPEDIFGNSESLTISIWTRAMRSAAWSRVWDIGNDTDHYFALMSPSSETKFACEIKDGVTDSDKARATSSQTFTTGSWKHVAVTYSQNGSITLYENGVQTGQTSVGSLKTADFGDISRAFIGRSMFSPDADYYGYVDEFKIYGGILTAEQIASEYDSGAKSIIQSAADSLNLAAYNSLSSLSHVQQNLSLPSKSAVVQSGAAVSWETSDESIMSKTGRLAGKTGGVTLTATLTRGEITTTKAFDVTVVEADDLTADDIGEIETAVGKKPSLPKKITANGGKATLTVEWDDIDPTQYAYAGESKISGIASNGEKVTAVIKTVDRMANLLIQNGSPDPYITYHDGYYYYVRSDGGICVAKSKRLADIGTAPRVTVWTAPSSGMYSKEVWAPEIHNIDGEWYIYFAADDGNNANHRMYCIKSTDPNNAQARYEMMGKLAPTSYNETSGKWEVVSEQDKWAIDGTVLQDVNGKNYFIWSGWEGNVDGRQNIYIAEMLNPYTLKGSRVLLSAPDTSWEQKGQTGVLVNEGPQIVKYGNKVHILYSANGSWTDWYSIGALTADASSDLLDSASWKKSGGPLFTQSLDPADCTYSTGHACVTTSPDESEYYFVYHAFHSSGGGWEDRSARVVRFRFDENDFPVLGNPAGESTYLEQPSGTDSIVSVKYEAETAELTNAKTASQAQRSNGKYVTGIDTNSLVTFNAKVPVSGVYQLNLMGSCPSVTSGNCYIDVCVNSKTTEKLRFRVNSDNRKTSPAFAAASETREGVYVKLAAGVNKITVTRSSGSGGTSDLDFMQLILTEQEDMTTAKSVNISESSLLFTIGESKQLSAEVLPEDAVNTDVVWSSDDESVVTVDENGNVTAVGAGTAVITAASYSNPEITAVCTVTVKSIPVTKITLDKGSLSLKVGEASALSAAVLPDNATDKSVVFTTSDESVVTVDENGNVTAVGAGTAVITAASYSNPEITAVCTVTVSKPADITTPAVTNGPAKLNGKTALYVNGKAVTGTQVVTVSGKTYAVVGGYVKTGKTQVVTISGKSYIVNTNGIVQKGTKNKLIKVGAKSYIVNKSGVVVKGSKNKLVKVGSKSYIVNKKGVVVKGAKNKLVKVGRKKYIVNKKGVVQKNKKKIKVGKKTYRTNKKGVATRKKK